jgi:hypothetical protein
VRGAGRGGKHCSQLGTENYRVNYRVRSVERSE